MMEIIGWVGVMMLASCGFPQALQSIKNGHSDGINNWLIFLWLGGEVLTLIYVSGSKNWPLIFNYTLNIIVLIPIAWYKMYPRKAHFSTDK